MNNTMRAQYNTVSPLVFSAINRRGGYHKISTNKENIHAAVSDDQNVPSMTIQNTVKMIRNIIRQTVID